MKTVTHRAGALLAVVFLLMAALVAGTGMARATTAGTQPGDSSEPCRIDWTAASINNIDLTDEDEVEWDGTVYTNLMTTPDGTEIADYSNGGFLTEISEPLGTPGGWMELQHWYGPDRTKEYTDAFWRFPVATATGFTNGVITVTLPAGTILPTTGRPGVTVSDVTSWYSGLAAREGSTWPPVYTHDYDWSSGTPSAWAANGDAPRHSQTTLPDGRVEVTIDLGTVPANSGIGLTLAGQVPTGNIGADAETDQIGVARVLGTIPQGTGDCAPAESGDFSEGCVLDWRGDATMFVNGRRNVPDVYRSMAVTPEGGSPGKFGVDGWTTVGQRYGDPATANGRFVLASDHPFTDGTWVLRLDRRVENPTFTVINPASDWRVDGEYPEPVTIDEGVWNPALNTMTYTVSGPARSSVIVQFSGDVTSTYEAGADYEFVQDLDATWVADPDNPECNGAPVPDDCECNCCGIGSVGSLGTGSLGSVGALGSLGSLGSVGALGSLGSLGSTGSHGSTGSLPIGSLEPGSPGSVAMGSLPLGSLALGSLGSLGSVGALGSKAAAVGSLGSAAPAAGSLGSLGSLGSAAPALGSLGSLGSLAPALGSFGSAAPGSLGSLGSLAPASLAPLALGSLPEGSGSAQPDDQGGAPVEGTPTGPEAPAGTAPSGGTTPAGGTAPAGAAAPKGASTPSRSQTVAQRALANTGVQIGLVGLASAVLIAGGAVLLTVRRRVD